MVPVQTSEALSTRELLAKLTEELKVVKSNYEEMVNSLNPILTPESIEAKLGESMKELETPKSEINSTILNLIKEVSSIKSDIYYLCDRIIL